jgi:hypothetical protein
METGREGGEIGFVSQKRQKNPKLMRIVMRIDHAHDDAHEIPQGERGFQVSVSPVRRQ